MSPLKTYKFIVQMILLDVEEDTFCRDEDIIEIPVAPNGKTYEEARSKANDIALAIARSYNDSDKCAFYRICRRE